MGEDEDATIRTLTTYRELMSTLIQKHRGRVVDSPGDNLLAEFGSVVDAVRCAVEIQEELRVRNAELPEDRKMVFRIGINLGDVVEEGERIYGDGINIAARVEGLAEGGGICISGSVYDSIKNKLSLSYESMGEHTVKNIREPVRVYRMRVGPEAADRRKSRTKTMALGCPGRGSGTHSFNRCRGDLELLFSSSEGRARFCRKDGIFAARQTFHCCAAICQHERRS